MKHYSPLRSILVFISLLLYLGYLLCQELPYSSTWTITNSNIQTCNTIRGQQDDYFYMGGKFSGTIDTNSINVVSPDRFNNSVVLATSLSSEAYALKVQKSSGKVDSSIQFTPNNGNSETTVQNSEIIAVGSNPQFQVFAGIINSNQGIFISKFNANGMEWIQTYLFSSGYYITVRDTKVVDTNIVIVGTYRGDISINNASIVLTSSSSQDYENMFIALLDMSGAVQHIYTNNGNSVKVIPENLHLSSNGEFCYVMGIFSGSTLSFTKSSSSSEQLTLTSTASTDQYDLFHLKYSLTNKELVWLMSTTGPSQADYSYKIVGSSPSTTYAFREIVIDQSYAERTSCGGVTNTPISTLTRNMFTLLSSGVLFGVSSAQNLNFFKALDFAGFSNSILFDNGTTSSIMNISRSTPLTLSSDGFTTCPNKQTLMNYTTEFTLNYNTASNFETLLVKSNLVIPKILFTTSINVGVINYAGISSTLTFNIPNVLPYIDKNLVIDIGGTKRPVKTTNGVYTVDFFSTRIGWNNISIYFNNTAQNRYDLISLNSMSAFFFDDSLVVSTQNNTILFNSSNLSNSRSSLMLTGLLNSTYSFPQDYTSSIMCRVAQQYFSTNIDGNQITCINVPYYERNTTVTIVYRYSSSVYFNISRSLDLSFVEMRTLSAPSNYRAITTDEQTKGFFTLGLSISKTLDPLDIRLQATNQNGAVYYLTYTISSVTSILVNLTLSQYEKATLKFLVRSLNNDYVDLSNTVSVQFVKQVKFASLYSSIDSNRLVKTTFSIQPNLLDSLKSQVICQYNAIPTLRTALNTTDNSCNVDDRLLAPNNNTLQLLQNMGNGIYLQISDSISLTSPALPTIFFQFVPNFGINSFTNITTTVSSQDLLFAQLKTNLQLNINSIRYNPTVSPDGQVYFPLMSTSTGWNNITVLGKYSSNDTTYSVIGTQSKIFFFNNPQSNIFSFTNGNVTLLTPSSSRNFMIDLVLNNFEIPYSSLNPNNFFCNMFGQSYSAQFVSTSRVQCQNVVSREGETDTFITISFRNSTFEMTSRSLFTFVKTREIKPIGVSLVQSTDTYIGLLSQSQTSYSMQITIEDSLFTALPIENTQKLSIQLTNLLTNQKELKYPQITRGMNMSTLTLNLDVNTAQTIFKYEARALFKGMEISQQSLKYLLVREAPIGKVISERDAIDNLIVSFPRILSTNTVISDDEKFVMDRLYCMFGDSTNATFSKVEYSSTSVKCKISTDFTSTLAKSIHLYLSVSGTTSPTIKISSNPQQVYPIYCYNIPHYLPTVCSSKGVCKLTDNCTCVNNYQGNDCSFTQCFGIPSTDKTVCSGNGQCPVSNICQCNAGFIGTKCENRIMYLSDDKSWITTSEAMSVITRSQLVSLVEGESLLKVENSALFISNSVNIIGTDSFCFVNSENIVIMLNRNVVNNTLLVASSTIGSVLSKSYSQYQVVDTKGKSTSPEIHLRTSFSNVNFPIVVEPLIVSVSPLSNLELSWQSDDPTINSQLSGYGNQAIIKLNMDQKTRQSGASSNGAINLTLQVADSTFNTLTKYSTLLLLNQSSNTGEAIFNYGGEQIECQSFASCDVSLYVSPIKGSSITSSVNPFNGNVTTQYIHNLKDIAEGCSTVYSLRTSERKKLCIKIRDKGLNQYYFDISTLLPTNTINIALYQFNTSTRVYSPYLVGSDSDTWTFTNLNTNSTIQVVKESSTVVSFKGIKQQEPYEIKFTNSLGKTSSKIQFSTAIQLKLLTFIPKIMGRRSSLSLSLLVESDGVSGSIQQVDFLLTKRGQSQSIMPLPITQQTRDLTFTQALLNTSLLDGGYFYTLRVQARNSKGDVSYVENSFYVQLETNYNVICSTSPKEGIAFETEFTISCFSNNLDIDSYQFLMTNGTNQIEISKGRKRAFFTRLPFLQNSKLQVKTKDIWNSEKIVNIPIQVRHPKQIYQSYDFSQYLTRKIQDLLNEEIAPKTLGYDYVNTLVTFMSILGADYSIVPNYEYRNELGSSLLEIFEKIIHYANKNMDSTYMGRTLPSISLFMQTFTNTTLINRDRAYSLVNSTLDALQDFSANNPGSIINDIFPTVDIMLPLVSKDLQIQLLNKVRQVNQQNIFDNMKNGNLVSNFSKNTYTFENYKIINLNILGRKIYLETIYLEDFSLSLPSQITSDASALFEVNILIYRPKTTLRRTLLQLYQPNYIQVNVKKNAIPLSTDSLYVNVTFPLTLVNKTAQCRSFSFHEVPKNHSTIQLDSSVICMLSFADMHSRNLYVEFNEVYQIGNPIPSNIVKTPLYTDNTLTIALATIFSTIALACICGSLIVLLFLIGKRGIKKRNTTVTEYTYKASGQHSPIGISDHSSSDKHSDTSSERQQQHNSQPVPASDSINLELLNGQYQLLDIISLHSTCTFYRANNITTNQIVTIKKMEFSSFEEINSSTSSIVKEYTNMSRAHHPHIVKLYETFVDTGRKAVCLALEYFELGNLNQLLDKRIQQNQHFEEIHIGQILYQLSQALSCLHDEYEMCHRNLRLENVYVRHYSPQKIDVCIGEFTNSRSRNSLKIEHDIQDQPFGSTMSSYRFGHFTKALKENVVKSTSDIFTSEDVFQLGCLIYKVMSFDTESDISTLFEEHEFEQDVFTILESKIHSSYTREMVSIILSMVTFEDRKRPTMNQVTNLLGNVFKFETQ